MNQGRPLSTYNPYSAQSLHTKHGRSGYIRSIAKGLLACWVVSATLTGCINLRLPTSHDTTTYQKKPAAARYRDLEQMTDWHISGAFSIQDNKHSAIAHYDWLQSGSHYTINIYSALHLYNIRIVGDTRHVLLLTSHKKYYTASTPEKLMQHVLGWTLPVSSLIYWIRGLPAPGVYHAQTDAYGHLSKLSQAGWILKFSQYLSLKGVDLPQILQLNSGPLKIKIVVQHRQMGIT